ncbi:sirohydrochlorin chelatase [Halioxenophilus aromaticivorans]|uniref:Cobalamin biosynthesis protein CbiX n=1 Tax=Halioxenophilus aromaticivorans TaxID=1306992 RepID=A0AAV3TX40_9ALTE
MTQRSLVIVAHGSRAEAANAEFLQLVDKLKTQLTGSYAGVFGAFLELAEPSIPHAILEAAAEGKNGVDVYPMFFNCGKHVQRDIPGIVEAVMGENPALDICLMDYFGSGSHLASAMAQHIVAQAEE